MAIPLDRKRKVEITCKECGAESVFDQPYPFHAGFGNQGFLYDDSGLCTLVWSSFDPDYQRIVGERHPWTLSRWKRRKLERALALSPAGGKWLFRNPPRCASCGNPIGESPLDCDRFLMYPGSLSLDCPPEFGLRDALCKYGKTLLLSCGSGFLWWMLLVFGLKRVEEEKLEQFHLAELSLVAFFAFIFFLVHKRHPGKWIANVCTTLTVFLLLVIFVVLGIPLLFSEWGV